MVQGKVVLCVISILGFACAARMGSDFAEADIEHSAAIRADSLDPELFTGATAWAELCTHWSESTPSHTYLKKGCMNDCATLKIDCNTGDDDGIIKLVYSRHSRKIFDKETVFSIFKKHRAHKNGKRFLIYRTINDQPVQEGCLEWMKSPGSWCEGAKWSKKEDDKGYLDADLAAGAEWELTYNWLSYDEGALVWRLEEDVVKGTRKPDEPLVTGLVSQEKYLGPNIGTVGPAVDTTYLTGATDFSPTCFENDKPVGTDLPVEEDKTCDITLWKASPKTGQIVKSVWVTTHMATELKKEFSS